MKKLIVVALLMSLNLYTMDCCHDNKPYKKYRDQILQTLDIDQNEYNDLKEAFKPLKRNRTNFPGCFTGIARAMSRTITFHKRYLNQ